jgi:hypothetical protein
VWLAVCDQVVRRVPRTRVLDVAYGWSTRVQAMYITHWVIVGWGVGIVGFQRLGLVPVLVAMGIVVVLTSLLTMTYPLLATRFGLGHRRSGIAGASRSSLAATDRQA